MISNGFVATQSGDRYVQQLVKHWSHRMATTYTDGIGRVPFSETTEATLTANDDGIAIALTTPSAEDDVRMREVIENHLNRFAFREVPLDYRWEPAA